MSHQFLFRSLGLLALLATLFPGAEEVGAQSLRKVDSNPVVRRVEVPADQLPALLPPGTPIRSMPLPEFDALIEELQKAENSQRLPGSPQVLRVWHQATFDGTQLIGTTELLIEASSHDALIPLNPWSAAVSRPATGEATVLSSTLNQSFIAIQPGPQQTIKFRWTAVGRKVGDNVLLELLLPDHLPASLELDIPDRFRMDEGKRPSHGPLKSKTTKHQHWQIDDARGVVALQFRPADSQDSGTPGPIPSVSGFTKVIHTASENSWMADWQIDAPHLAEFELRLDIDSRIEIDQVLGECVDEFRLEHQNTGAYHLVIKVIPQPGQPDNIRIEGKHHSSLEGPWAVPTLTTHNAIWTGGEYQVEIDPGVRVESIDEKHSVRMPVADQTSGRKTQTENALFQFESTGTGTPALLLLQRRNPERNGELFGAVKIDSNEIRFEARLTWLTPPHGGDPLNLVLDPGWTVDHFQIVALDEPTTWSVKGLRTDGSQEIDALVPVSVPVRSPMTAVIRGRGTVLDRSELRPPRIQTPEVRWQDETWCMVAASHLSIRPVRVQGARWIDPSMAYRELSTFLQGWTEPISKIAWKSSSSEQIPTFQVGNRSEQSTVTAWVVTNFGTTTPHTEWFFQFNGMLGKEHLGFRSNVPLTGEISGQLVASHHHQAVSVNQIHGDAAGQVGPSSAFQLRVDIPLEFRGESQLLLRVALPPSVTPEGVIALPALDPETWGDRYVLLHAEPGFRLESTSSGLQKVDPQTISQELGRVFSGEQLSSLIKSDRVSLQDAYRIIDANSSLNAISHPLTKAGQAGVIEEAELLESLRPDGQLEAELALTFRTDDHAALEIQLGAQDYLVDFLVNEVRTPPKIENGRLRVELSKLYRVVDGLSHLRLRYTRPAQLAASANQWKSAWPGFSYPCLTMRWWPASATEVRSEDSPQRSRVATRTGNFVREVLNRWQPNRSHEPSWSKLEERFQQAYDPTCTLGEMLLRIDRPQAPIVIDTTAIRFLGLRYGSRPLSTAGPDNLPGLANWLRSWGLAAITRPQGTLVTSLQIASQYNSDPTWLETNLRTAVQQRYEARLRWVSASSWPSLGNGPPIDLEHGLMPTRSLADSLIQSGNESLNPGVAEPTGSSRILVPLILGLMIATLGWYRGFSRSSRIVLSLLAIGLGIWFLAAPTLSDNLRLFRQGLALGASLCGVMILLSRRPQTAISREQTPNQRPSSMLRRAVAPMVMAPLVLTWSGPWVSRAADNVRDEIVVLLPYEKVGDQLIAPTRVIMRLDDFERLQEKLRKPTIKPSTLDRPCIRWASHRLEQQSDGQFLLTSIFDLDQTISGRTNFVWPFGEALSLHADIEEKPLAIKVVPERKEAHISVLAATARVRIQQLFAQPADNTSLTIPLLPVTTSDFLLVGKQVHCSLIGMVREPVQAGLQVPLGPVNSLTVSPSQAPAKLSQKDPLRISKAFWDIEPAGDTLQLQLRSGTVREGNVSALLIDGHWNLIGFLGENANRQGQVLNVSSTRDGQTRIEFIAADSIPSQVTLWRSSDDSNGLGQEHTPPRFRWSEGEDSQPISAYRLAPLMRPIGKTNQPTEEASLRFRSGWGPIRHPDWPIQAITAGYPTAFDQVSWLSPTAAEQTVSVTTTIQMHPDRMALQFDATLNAQRGLIDRVPVKLPADFHLEKAEGLDLTDAFTDQLDQFVLCFAQKSLKSSSVRIEGWIPLTIDPRAAATEPRRMEIPVLNWVNTTQDPGFLTVETVPEISVELDKSAGLVPDFSISNGGLTGLRSRYRIEPGAQPIQLQWVLLGRPSRVNVASHLMLYPESAQWEADVHYAIDHGPLHQLILELPGDWSEHAEFRVAGSRSIVRKITQGHRTRVEIQLLEPCWGEAQLSLRSELPRTAAPFSFPDITPLGLGKVDTYIAWSDFTGQNLAAEGSSGIQPVEASRFQDRAPSLGSAIHTHAYHVLRSGWTLRVREPLKDQATKQSQSWITRVELTVAPDGSSLGTTRVESRNDRTDSLVLDVPDGTTFLGATVNGRWVACAWLAKDRVIIPTGTETRWDIQAYWSRAAGTKAKPISPQVLPPLPAVDDLVFSARLLSTQQLQLTALQGNLGQVNPSDFFTRELQAKIGQIQDTAASLDRSDEESRELFLADLVDFELELREAEHQLGSGVLIADDPEVARSPEFHGDLLQRWSQELEESLATYGLDSLLIEARVQAGMEQGGKQTRRPAIPRRVSPSQRPMLPGQHQPLYFQGRTSFERLQPGIRLTVEQAQPGSMITSAALDHWFQLALPLVVLIISTAAPKRLPLRLLGMLLVALAWWAGQGWPQIPLL